DRLRRENDANNEAADTVRRALEITRHELLRIRRSLAWRAVQPYGRFKYRYLLPVYGLFCSEPARSWVERGLRWQVDTPLPKEIAIGKGTAVFLMGSCYHPTRKIRSLVLHVDGEDQELKAWRMGRSDLLNAHRKSIDPLGHSYASGFWGFACL